MEIQNGRGPDGFDHTILVISYTSISIQYSANFIFSVALNSKIFSKYLHFVNPSHSDKHALNSYIYISHLNARNVTHKITHLHFFLFLMPTFTFTALNCIASHRIAIARITSNIDSSMTMMAIAIHRPAGQTDSRRWKWWCRCWWWEQR